MTENNPIHTLPPLRDVIARHDLRAQKSLGQNFLLDLNLTGRIAAFGGSLENINVVEIGPGPGGLTRAILDQGAKHLTVIERDHRCIKAQQEISAAYPGRLTIIEGDALKEDPASLVPAPRAIIANLPYNVATPLLIGWLKNIKAYQSLTLMFQKEVADRLLAKPATKAYGRLSVMTQWLCDVRPAFNVDRKAFTPPPKVISTVVHLTPRVEPLAEARWNTMEKVVAEAFGKRRKMLRASLKGLGLDLEKAGIDPTLRAENLDIKDFCKLANLLESS